MPSNDESVDMSKVRGDMDTVQIDVTEDVSEMQDPVLVYPQTLLNPEDVEFRVVMSDFGCVENEELFIDYFDNYDDAVSTFDALSDDTDFIKHHDQSSVVVILQKAYRGFGKIFWETIRKSVIYDASRD